MTGAILKGLLLAAIILPVAYIFFKRRYFSVIILVFIALPVVKLWLAYKKEPKKIDDHLVEFIFVFLPTCIVTIYTNRDKLFGFFREKTEEFYLEKIKGLEVSHENYSDLMDITRRFFNGGTYSRQRILELFQVTIDDYFCVMKSSENLELLYEKKRQLGARFALGKFPLGSLLAEIPNRIQPFGNMDVYFVPYASIAGYGKNYQKWLRETIIGPLENVRRTYLEEVRRPLRLSRREFENLSRNSYAIMAFEVNNTNIFFEMENNYISEDLMRLLRRNAGSFRNVTNEIRQTIASQEAFQAISWSGIANIKKQYYLDLLNEYSQPLRERLQAQGINTIQEIPRLPIEEFSRILNGLFGRRKSMTPRKCHNIAVSIQDSIVKIQNTLQAIGVNM